MRDLGVTAFLLAGLAVLAGCTDAPAQSTGDPIGPSDAPEAVPERASAAPDMLETPAASTSPLTSTACRETQAQASASAEDFEGLPAGYGPTLDGMGQATLVFVHQDCVEGATVWVFFLLEVPEAMRRSDAVHGGVLMAWTDDEAMGAALAGARFDFERHDLQATTNDLGDVITTRIADDDSEFVFTVHAAGDPTALPFGRLRLIDVDDGTIGAIFDRERPAISGRQGVATAQLLPTADDLLRLNPASEHQGGTGALSLDAVDVTLGFVAARP